MSSSDSRIKTNIQNITDSYSLEKIRQIQPRIYNYIDTNTHGNKLVHGFIAQETSTVIPESVNKQQQYIPNIYTNGIYNSKTNTITLQNKTTDCIDINNRSIKIYNSQNNELYITLDRIIDKYSFIIVENYNLDATYFIYGQLVNDFNVLEKEAIFTLTTAAVKALDNENQELKTKVNKLEDIITRLSERLSERLELLESKML